MQPARENDIQRFDHDGTWTKPDGAVRIEVVLQGNDPVVLHHADGSGIAAISVGSAASGFSANTEQRFFSAAELPQEMPVTVGQPGGQAAVITHFED
jgi:hypothetical protein